MIFIPINKNPAINF